MHTGRGETEKHIAFGHIAARQDLAPLNGTNGKTSEIIVAGGIHTRHLGRFTANQRGSGKLAAVRDARNNVACRVDIQGHRSQSSRERTGVQRPGPRGR